MNRPTAPLAILDEPYVSPVLLSSLRRLQIPTLPLDSRFASSAPADLLIASREQAANALQDPSCRLLTNSENALSFVLRHAPDTRLAEQVRAVKDKGLFRDRLASPGFWHRRVPLEHLADLSPAALQFPLVMKPACGFFSLGVRVVAAESDWLAATDAEIEELRRASVDQSQGAGYPTDVLDTTEILLEQYIHGHEIAVDAVYDDRGSPTVLNIYRHEFPHDGRDAGSRNPDLRDVLYYTSAQTVAELHDKVHGALTQIGSSLGLVEFPVHVEFRETSRGRLFPIEVNPARFAGWGTADLGRFAFGFTAYDAFFTRQSPDWQQAAAHAGTDHYGFVIGYVPDEMKSATEIRVDWDRYHTVLGDVIESRPVDPLKWGIFAITFVRITDVERLQELCCYDPSDVLSASRS